MIHRPLSFRERTGEELDIGGIQETLCKTFVELRYISVDGKKVDCTKCIANMKAYVKQGLEQVEQERQADIDSGRKPRPYL